MNKKFKYMLFGEDLEKANEIFSIYYSICDISEIYYMQKRLGIRNFKSPQKIILKHLLSKYDETMISKDQLIESIRQFCDETL